MARLLEPVAKDAPNLRDSSSGSDGVGDSNTQPEPPRTIGAHAVVVQETEAAVSLKAVNGEPHGVPVSSESKSDVLVKVRHSPSVTVNSAGEKIVVPHSRAWQSRQNNLSLSGQVCRFLFFCFCSFAWQCIQSWRLSNGSRVPIVFMRTSVHVVCSRHKQLTPSAADGLPQLSAVSCHLVPVVADAVQAFLRASGDVQHALVRNNRTRAGDEPQVRTSLFRALQQLEQIGRTVAHIEHFLRTQQQPILQELAAALATASSHATETCRVAPLLLTAASIMQACARRLATEDCTNSTRSFLLNVSLQFDACCEARDWGMLQALVDIHGMLRFGAGRSGFDNDAEAKLRKVHFMRS